ncbi:hypothetical protein HYH03_005763 [Edaphochlamys debaryana]|uniref:Uncharacterized protein n=1 Tax=Edaphochlamys debaryana TaxID=47281 RepID=A0A835Y8H7_9CHLO|nr:hypothetical protein HYH03_005763 [Edaphochlamys debaryana]|eukprot:KAG2496161.1 hypothetical protein HYH03_005763 [Edaphochlamys debaryana]
MQRESSVEVASSGQAPPTSGPSRIARDLAPLALDEAQLAKVADHVSKTAAERDLAASVEALVTYTGSARSARGLALQHPDLLACQLPSWCDFLTGFGLDKSQLQHLLCSAPEALTRGDLVRAGEAMLTMRRLGLCERSAAQLVTYYPQLLNKDEPEILSLLKLLGRYQIGIDTTTL